MDLHCECKGAMEVLHRRGQGQALGLLWGVAREAWSERKKLEPGKGLWCGAGRKGMVRERRQKASVAGGAGLWSTVQCLWGGDR